MNIGFFVWEFFPRLIGGLGTYAVEITKKFKEYKNNVTVFTINDGNLKTREVLEGIEVHRPLLVDAGDIFPMFVVDDLKKWGSNIKFFSDVYIYNLLSATKFVNDLVKKNKTKFDLVCIHDWLSSVSGFLIKKELPNLPLVFHIHSIEEQRCLNGGSEVIKHFERKMAECANKIITVSYSMKDFLVSIGYSADKIEVVYNGCDPEKYDPSKVNKEKVEELKERYKIKADEKIILFVGRLVPVKGVHNLIQAMPQVLKEFPEAKLIILGKGEQFDDLVTLSQQYKISEKVRIHSQWVSEEERIAHYALADVCVFPSLSEPFGIVSLESMAMKKPLVVGASGVNGLKEQVIPSGENRTGVHVDGRSPEDIAWGIKEVLKNQEEAKRWGENGRRRVLKEFTWEITTKKTLKIYEELTK